MQSTKESLPLVVWVSIVVACGNGRQTLPLFAEETDGKTSSPKPPKKQESASGVLNVSRYFTGRDIAEWRRAQGVFAPLFP